MPDCRQQEGKKHNKIVNKFMNDLEFSQVAQVSGLCQCLRKIVESVPKITTPKTWNFIGCDNIDDQSWIMLINLTPLFWKLVIDFHPIDGFPQLGQRILEWHMIYIIRRKYYNNNVFHIAYIATAKSKGCGTGIDTYYIDL